MADPPDLSALAKRYVDLWQDQLIALAAHPELAEGLARMLAAFPFPSVTWPPAAGTAPSHNGHASSAAPRTAPAAAAPGGGDQQLRQLARRLAALEERLSRLETGAAGSGQRARKKPRRRRR
jgi:hypothetical protein